MMWLIKFLFVENVIFIEKEYLRETSVSSCIYVRKYQWIHDNKGSFEQLSEYILRIQIWHVCFLSLRLLKRSQFFKFRQCFYQNMRGIMQSTNMFAPQDWYIKCT